MAQIRSSGKCDWCDENMGTYYCYECQQGICTSCRKLHDKASLFKKHKITDLQHVDRSVLKKSTTCQSHESEYVYFCENCKSLICSVCVTTCHKGHVFVDIESIYNEERELLKEQSGVLLSNIKDLSALVEKIRTIRLPKIEKESTKYRDSFEYIATELKNIIDFVAETGAKDGENFYENGKQHLTYKLAELEKIQKEYIDTQRRVTRYLEEEHKTCFVSLSKTVMNDIRALDKIPEEPEQERTLTLNKEDFLTKVIDQVMTKYEIRVILDKEKEIKDLTFELIKSQEKIKQLEKEIENLKEEKVASDEEIAYLSDESDRYLEWQTRKRSRNRKKGKKSSLQRKRGTYRFGETE